MADQNSGQRKLLVVDDDELALRAMQRGLQGTFEVHTFSDPRQAQSFAASHDVELAVVDLNMPHVNGLELLGALHRQHPSARTVLVSGWASSHDVVQAVQLGASDFFTKPVELTGLERRLRELCDTAVIDSPASPLVGTSPQIIALRRLIEKVAMGVGPVLIGGESGTGKELVARAIHHMGRRGTGPFVAVNSAALTDSLVDSELFGHARGAFTGATSERAGLFEAAEQGVLFLDEIGELPMSTQVRLLRALQNGEIRRVGASNVINIDVRVVGATNVDLAEAIRQGRFREDLFYRLSTFQVWLPPLRERMADLPLLIDHFLPLLNRRMGKTVTRVSPETMEVLARHTWPGNVRELQNVLEYAVTMATSDTLRSTDLPSLSHRPGRPPVFVSAPEHLDLYSASRNQAIERFDREYLRRLLDDSKGRLGDAARRSGIDRSNLRRLLLRYGMLPHNDASSE